MQTLIRALQQLNVHVCACTLNSTCSPSPYSLTNQHGQQCLPTSIDCCGQVRVLNESSQQGHPHPLLGRVHDGQSSTPTLLPAVTIGIGRGTLETTVVTAMTGVCTLSAAAKSTRQSTGTTLEYVLVDVLLSCPGEGTGVTPTQDKERVVIRMAACGEQHGGETLCVL